MKEHHKDFNERISKAVEKACIEKGISPEQLLEMLKKGPPPEEEKRMREKTKEMGRRLREARESQNLSLQEVAKAADITVTELNFIEEDTWYTRMAVIDDIMRALKVDPKTIMGGL